MQNYASRNGERIAPGRAPRSKTTPGIPDLFIAKEFEAVPVTAYMSNHVPGIFQWIEHIKNARVVVGKVHGYCM